MKNKVDKNNYFKLHDNCTSFNPKFLLIILLFKQIIILVLKSITSDN